jgi:hypothetical protein
MWLRSQDEEFRRKRDALLRLYHDTTPWAERHRKRNKHRFRLTLASVPPSVAWRSGPSGDTACRSLGAGGGRVGAAYWNTKTAPAPGSTAFVSSPFIPVALLESRGVPDASVVPSPERLRE